MEAPSTGEAIRSGMSIASAINHIRNNRVEWLLVTLLMYSMGALDQAIAYGTGLCV